MKNTDLSPIELFSSYPDVMTAQQLRTALGIGRLGAYKLLEEGKIQSFKIGNTYKIPKTAVIEYITQSCEKGAKTIRLAVYISKTTTSMLF